MKFTKIISIIITAIILIAVSIAYFALGNQNASMSVSKADPAIYSDIKFKVVYNDEGFVDVYAFAKNNILAKYKTSMGDSVPEKGTIVLGSTEGMMMQSEDLFSKPGDKITEVPGVDLIIGGVLQETASPIDQFHFLGETDFEKVKGEENKLYVKLNDENIPKLFFVYSYNKKAPINIELFIGNLSYYSKHEILGETYYPLIVGFKEAKMMQEEKLFSKPGDTIKDLFGKNFIVIGVLVETNTSLDMMHLVPLTEDELN
ncbi:MAG: hypothetical protein WC758_06020 [Candidatus Woesearchaeota archaeon]|jgi:hypothetical protein